MSVLGKKGDKRRGGLKVHLVCAADAQRTEVRTALTALGDPPLELLEIEPGSDAGATLVDTTFPTTGDGRHVAAHMSYWIYPGSQARPEPFTSATRHPR